MSTGIERITLLLGRNFLRPWLRQALLKAERETGASVELIVRTDTGGRQPAETFEHPFDADVHYTKPIPLNNSPGVRLSEETVQKVARNTDVAVQNGVGILSGDILTAPEHGVLSYHHGDIRRYRGAITHFWNYMNGDETAGVTVLQLSETLDGGAIAAECNVDLTGCTTWSEVEARKHIAGVPLLAGAIENLGDPKFEPETIPEDDLGRMYYSSDVTLPVIARYILRETALTTYDRLLKLRYLLGVYRNR